MRFLGAVPNKALTNHTLKRVKVDNHITCQLECLGEHGCLSINFVKRQEGDGDCELNSSEDSQHPGNLEEQEGTIYYSSQVGDIWVEDIVEKLLVYKREKGKKRDSHGPRRKQKKEKRKKAERQARKIM